MTTCLVTGAAGFIGSTLSEKLITKGMKVVGIDSFTDYYSKNIKESNILNLRKSDSFTFINDDINRLNLESILTNIDYVFHLAAQPGVRTSWGNQFTSYVKNNIEATQKLLEGCSKSGIKKFIFSSSSSVYGNQDKMPIKEDACLNPASPYGVTKLACEHICRLYIDHVPCIVLRYFTVYGPRQRPDMAFNKFIRSIISGETLTVYGNGEQTRDFTYIDDVITATIATLEYECTFDIMNIGGGSHISLNDTIKIINHLTKEKANIEKIDAVKGDMKDTYADISQARKKINYKPKTDIMNGMKKEVEWVISKKFF